MRNAHRADKAKTGDCLQEITKGEVACWLAATMMFTLSITTENFMQKHSKDEFQRQLRRWRPLRKREKS